MFLLKEMHYLMDLHLNHQSEFDRQHLQRFSKQDDETIVLKKLIVVIKFTLIIEIREYRNFSSLMSCRPEKAAINNIEK